MPTKKIENPNEIYQIKVTLLYTKPLIWRRLLVPATLTLEQLHDVLQLPLALRVIIAGVRVATVISVGVATIAAAIGAGGLGEYIFRGLAMVNNQLILAGAIPAALLALLADFGLGIVEKSLQPS